jgi:predicted enzyme related to lactoylglutathione lyase
MPPVDAHAPGTFCWFELATTDQAGAKQFYQSMFGWSVQDSPMGSDETYSLFKLNDRDVAAAYTMRADQQAQGVPPNWLAYVRVDSADAAAAHAAAAGGQVLAPAFDVMDLGRMAVLQDPTGGVFAVWEPTRHQGTGLAGEHGTVVWTDLMTSDQSRAAEFYRSLFGWRFVAGKTMAPAAPGEYFHIVNGEAFIGGIPPVQGDQPHAAWLIYIGVPDCRQAIARAQSLGGRLVHGPMTIEGARTFAALADPQGAVFAVVETDSRKVRLQPDR